MNKYTLAVAMSLAIGVAESAWAADRWSVIQVTYSCHAGHQFLFKPVSDSC